MKRLEFVILGALVSAYLVIGILFALKTPAWQVPDEPAHYNYIRQVAQQGCCPLLEMGDWNNGYLEQLKAAKFAPALLGQLNTIQYEDHQPPLYYLLASPIFAATTGNITWLRLFSVLLGAGVVIITWLLTRTLFPNYPYVALAAAAFVAFIPQHVAMMAGVENDALAELLVGTVLLICALYLGNPVSRSASDTIADNDVRRASYVHPAILGVVLGLTFITKLTAMFPMIPVVGLTVLLRARDQRWSIARLARELVWVAVPALIFGLPLWLRNMSAYGGLDIFAQGRHDSVVIGQTRTQDYIAQYGVGTWLRNGVQTTFDSFWGQFGWMAVPMTMPFIYPILLLFTVLVSIGATVALIQQWPKISNPLRYMIILLGFTIVLAFIQDLAFNLKFVQFQGRYLFIALIPMGIAAAVGLRWWVKLLFSPLVSRWPTLSRHIGWIIVPSIALFALFDLYVLFRIIIPNLS